MTLEQTVQLTKGSGINSFNQCRGGFLSEWNSLSLTAFEILYGFLVFLRRSLAIERAEIFSSARSRIFLAGIQPIPAGFQFPDHYGSLGASVTTTQILRKLRSDAR
jgi:hypothetical protein